MATPYDQLYANNPAYTKDQFGTYRDQSGNPMYDTTGAQPGQAAMGSGFLSGVNFNGGIVDTPQNYSNPSDPFTVGYGTPNPSAGMQAPSGGMGALSGGGYPMGQQTPMPKPQGQDSMGFGGVGSQPGGATSGSLGNVQAMGGGMQQNPYLPQMFDAVTNQVTTNFNRNVMPRIQSQMAASGGYGGSRQGVVEANAMRDMNEVLANSLSGLAGNAYGQSLNYDLGLRGNDLGYANLDANINQNNFNNQLTGANFGLGLYDRLQMGNQAGIGAGTNIQNTPMNYWSQFGNQFNSIGQGYGSTTGSNSQGGNPAMGALGGWQLGSQWSNSRPQVGSWNDTTYGPAF